MEKGILIESCEMGFLIDKTYLINYDDASDILSKYFFSSYWQSNCIMGDIDELIPSDIFIKSTSCAPLPCASQIENVLFSSNPKFAAGFLKNFVLMNLVRILLLPDSEAETDDIERIIDFCVENKLDRYGILDKANHILCLCNEVFLEQDEKKAKALLKPLADAFNTYFERNIQDSTGWNFTFEIFDGASELRDDLAKDIFNPDNKERFCRLMSQDEWSFDEKLEVLGFIYE